MDVPCARCRKPAPRVRVHRTGNRLLCAACFRAVDRALSRDPAGEAPGDATGPREILRRAAFAAGAGLAAKTLLFLPLFLWARASHVGAAALRGAVGGDLFGWAVLTVLLWPFRRLQVGAGTLLEVVLVAVYLKREALFEISADAEITAVSVLFFFGVFFAKTGLWALDHILEITGVKETS